MLQPLQLPPAAAARSAALLLPPGDVAEAARERQDAVPVCACWLAVRAGVAHQQLPQPLIQLLVRWT